MNMQNGLDWFMNKDRPQGWDGRGMTHEIDRLKAANHLLREAIKANAIKHGSDTLEPWAARVLELTHNVK